MYPAPGALVRCGVAVALRCVASEGHVSKMPSLRRSNACSRRVYGIATCYSAKPTQRDALTTSQRLRSKRSVKRARSAAGHGCDSSHVPSRRRSVKRARTAACLRHVKFQSN